MRFAGVTMLVGMAFAACLVRPVKATSGTVNPGGPESGPGASNSTNAAASARVRNVELWPRGGSDHKFELGDQLVVNVEHPSALLKSQGQCRQQVVLFLDYLPVEGLAPKFCDP